MGGCASVLWAGQGVEARESRSSERAETWRVRCLGRGAPSEYVVVGSCNVGWHRWTGSLRAPACALRAEFRTLGRRGLVHGGGAESWEVLKRALRQGCDTGCGAVEMAGCRLHGEATAYHPGLFKLRFVRSSPAGPNAPHWRNSRRYHGGQIS